MKPSKLIYENVVGSGQHIKAQLDESIDCVEFRMIPNAAHSILIGYSPFIQFPEPKWDAMLNEVFQQMVEAWNDKYSKNVELDQEQQ